MGKAVGIQLQVISFVLSSLMLLLSSSRFIPLSHTRVSPLNEETKLNLHPSDVTLSDGAVGDVRTRELEVST
jgi:hypothetical protein